MITATSEKISLSQIYKENKIKFTGTYVDGDGNEKQAKKDVTVNLAWTAEKYPELNIGVSKFIPYEINGEKYLVLQMNVESYLKDNNDEIIIEGIIENWATRKLTINKEQIKIEDKNLKSNYVLTNWIINKDLHIDSNKIENDKLKISFKNIIYTNKKEIQISRGYLNKEKAILYNVKTLDNNNLETKIKFKEK